MSSDRAGTPLRASRTSASTPVASSSRRSPSRTSGTVDERVATNSAMVSAGAPATRSSRRSPRSTSGVDRRQQGEQVADGRPGSAGDEVQPEVARGSGRRRPGRRAGRRGPDRGRRTGARRGAPPSVTAGAVGPARSRRRSPSSGRQRRAGRQGGHEVGERPVAGEPGRADVGERRRRQDVVGRGGLTERLARRRRSPGSRPRSRRCAAGAAVDAIGMVDSGPLANENWLEVRRHRAGPSPTGSRRAAARPGRSSSGRCS